MKKQPWRNGKANYVIVREIGTIIVGLKVENCRYIWTTDLDQVTIYNELKQADKDSQVSILEMAGIKEDIESQLHIVEVDRAIELWKGCYRRAIPSEEHTTVYYDGKTVYFPIKQNEKYKRLLFGNDMMLIDLIPWEKDIEKIYHFYLRVKQELRHKGVMIFNIDRGKMHQLMDHCKRLWVICLD